MKCPQCFTAMKATAYKKVPGLILDQCYHCNGIWFDRGELNAIPQKAELETDFNYRPLATPIRKEGPEQAKITLTDGLPADFSLTPLTYLGLPAEETTTRSAGVSVAAILLSILCIIFSMKGFRSDQFLQMWSFSPQNPFRASGMTFLTSLFLHGGVFHLISNLYFLHVTSDNVEEVRGPWFVLLLFFTAGFAGKIIYVFSGATLPSIGASGGLCGVMAYYAMSFPNNRVRLLRPFMRRSFIRLRSTYTVSAQTLLFFYLISQTGYYFLARAGEYKSTTNFLAHIAGLTVGLVAYLLTTDHSKKT